MERGGAMSKKDLLRKEIKEKLKALSNEEYIQASRKIALHFFHSPYWQDADVIAFTISRGREVDTKEMIRRAWQEGKRVVVPRANFIKRSLVFYQLDHFDQLEETKYGLYEPITTQCTAIPNEQLQIIIVPGLAFAKDGSRLGYGGGFYDRYLPRIQAKTISFAFPCQIVATLPSEPHDQKVDHIITPSGFFR